MTSVAVVGAGAAGLMAAISAAGQAASGGPIAIHLFDTRQKIGAKILISGGTRCNVTNAAVTPFDYEGGPRHFIKHVLEAFTPGQTRDFFEQIGVDLVLEPSGKYFPVTHSGKTVLAALMRQAERLGVIFETGVRITEIKKIKDGFSLNRGSVTASRVILATGGLSYPETGSDGTGFQIAKSFGHRVTQTTPALTPLLTNDEAWKSLSGLALETKLSFYQSGKKCAERHGAFLFAHFGFSGPAALDISRFWAMAKKEDTPQIKACFLPGDTEDSLRHRFHQCKKTDARKQTKGVLSESFGLPARFVDVFLQKGGFDGKTAFGKLTQGALNRLNHQLLNFPLEVTGVYGYKKAEVTAGGVDLKELNVSTLESKLVCGLYFAGEILDIDGRIGGFNFQWAWSTGAIAGASAVKSLS